MPFLKEILPSVLADLEAPAKAMRSRLIDAWPSIAGPKIAPHTKPVLSDTGELRVWVDQATLAYELNQRHRPALLKRVQAVLGEEKVKTLRISVGQLR